MNKVLHVKEAEDHFMQVDIDKYVILECSCPTDYNGKQNWESLLCAVMHMDVRWIYGDIDFQGGVYFSLMLTALCAAGMDQIWF